MAKRPHRTWQAAVAISVAILLAASLAACTEETSSGQDDDTTEPTSSVEPTATDVGTTVFVYFPADERLVEIERVSDAPTAAVATTAMTALLDGPTGSEIGAGLGTEIPEGTFLMGVVIESGTATVNLSDAFDDGGGSLSMQMRVAQVVFTLTQFDSVDAVLFEMEGEPIEALGGEGLILSEPQTRDDWSTFAPADG